MTSDEEWIEDFRKEVRSIMEMMLRFNQITVDSIESWLEDPITFEKTIRAVLGAFGGRVRIGSPRGENRDSDVVGIGRQVAWSCENDKCTKNHCTQCGHHEARAGDGHTPWYALDLPACKPKPASRKDRRDRE
jgi:hypothetical protein